MNQQGWIGVDLDGTLAHYTKWVRLLHIGDPVWPMVERVKQWLSDGREVRIMTARIAPPFLCHFDGMLQEADVRTAIKDWTEEYIGERLSVTCSKDRHMIELWDDRCVQVEPNTGEPTTYWASRV